MYIPKEPCYLICNAQRKGRQEEIRRAARHARPHDSEDFASPWASARVWNRPASRTIERGSAQTQRRYRLYVSPAAPARGMDCLGLGHVGEQPQSEVLLNHQGRP